MDIVPSPDDLRNRVIEALDGYIAQESFSFWMTNGLYGGTSNRRRYEFTDVACKQELQWEASNLKSGRVEFRMALDARILGDIIANPVHDSAVPVNSPVSERGARSQLIEVRLSNTRGNDEHAHAF